MRWEGRGERVIRADGLDAVADDGSIRSFFGMRGGVAVWSTTRDLRDRILAAGEGRGDSLLRPDPRSYALARRTFPAAEGGALLVVPDGFLARADSAGLRAKRAAALRCEAARLLLDARSLAGGREPPPGFPALACPAGGTLHPVAGEAGSSCSLHGTASDPVPLGDLPAAAGRGARAADPIAAGAIPVAARWKEGGLEVLVPPLPAGREVVGILLAHRPNAGGGEGGRTEQGILARLDGLARALPPGRNPADGFAALTGTAPVSPLGRELRLLPGEAAAWTGEVRIVSSAAKDAPQERAGGGVLAVTVEDGDPFGRGEIGIEVVNRACRWR